MNSIVDKLYELILFHSDNGTERIEHPAFLAQEASKSLGISRAEIIEFMLKMERVGFLERDSGEDQFWSVKKMMPLNELKEVLSNRV